MAKPETHTHDQLFPVLSTAKGGLTYLTQNDWALITDKAKRVNFRKGDTLIQKAKHPNGVYVILKGSARVEIGSDAAISNLGPGQICGEMSFLEGTPAAATVLALEDVETYFIEQKTLQGLFELFPHLASRFYRSIATNLSRRLRELIWPKQGSKR